MNEDPDKLAEKADKHGTEAFKLFAEAQRWQIMAADANDESQRHFLEREAHSLNMEAVTHIRESDYLDSEMAKKQRDEIQRQIPDLKKDTK
jgi:hypothetical protein